MPRCLKDSKKMKSLQEIEGAVAGGGADLRHVERLDSLLFNMR